MSREAALRALPAVDEVLRRPAAQALVATHGRARVVAGIRAALDAARARILEGAGDAGVSDDAVAAAVTALARPRIRRVLNATGVVLHTGLGRAPLAPAALRAVQGAAGAASVELDLGTGRRGHRDLAITGLLRDLTGAEDAVVVGNGAAAVMLSLATVAAGREVVVSRGELVEIGGGFRIPEVLATSGCRLVEVGTTNRTRLADYQRAAGPGIGALLKVHRSNFAVTGFTEEVALGALAGLAADLGVPLIHDLGAGLPVAVPGALDGEPTVAGSLAAGVDLVCFSGDKLLGGPQAGLVAGRAEAVARVRRHPLMRALRPGKLTLAALEATLRAWRDGPEALPVVAMLRATVPDLAALGEEVCRLLAGAGVGCRLVPVDDAVGGGSAPGRRLPGMAVEVDHPDAEALSARLRLGEPAVVGVVREGRLRLHLRTVPPDALAPLAAAVRRAVLGA